MIGTGLNFRIKGKIITLWLRSIRLNKDGSTSILLGTPGERIDEGVWVGEKITDLSRWVEQEQRKCDQVNGQSEHGIK